MQRSFSFPEAAILLARKAWGVISYVLWSGTRHTIINKGVYLFIITYYIRSHAFRTGLQYQYFSSGKIWYFSLAQSRCAFAGWGGGLTWVVLDWVLGYAVRNGGVKWGGRLKCRA